MKRRRISLLFFFRHSFEKDQDSEKKCNISAAEIIEYKAGIKKGGIFMRQKDIRETVDIITMEEYLRRRQAISRKKNAGRQIKEEKSAAALKLAELLFV